MHDCCRDQIFQFVYHEVEMVRKQLHLVAAGDDRITLENAGLNTLHRYDHVPDRPVHIGNHKGKESTDDQNNDHC